MKKNQFLVIFAIGLALTGLLVVAPILAAPASAQIYLFTPTAEANGNIYYVVKDGDTCDSIALINFIDVQVLRNINQLNLDDCRFLQVGRKLLLGSVPTAVITAGPSPTPTSILPTPQPVKGFGTICVYLFDDINGNAMADIGEKPLAGGAISIANSAGNFTRTGTSVNTLDSAGDPTPICFSDAPEGEYTVSIAIPDGYNATASQNYTIHLKAGDTSTVDFSAQASSSLILSNSKSGSVFLAVIGGLILLGGIGLGIYVKFFLRK